MLAIVINEDTIPKITECWSTDHKNELVILFKNVNKKIFYSPDFQRSGMSPFTFPGDWVTETGLKMFYVAYIPPTNDWFTLIKK